MPDHVKNLITFRTDAERDRAVRALSAPGRESEADYVLDFQKLIPMPESLWIESGSMTAPSLAAWCAVSGRPVPERYESAAESLLRRFREQTEIPDFKAWIEAEDAKKDRRLSLPLGRMIAENLEKYGTPDWYEWRVEHWGTKWNSYGGATGEKSVSFLTAWSEPEPVLLALAARFPDTAFRTESVFEADPGVIRGADYGRGVKTGEFIREDPQREAEIFALPSERFSYERFMERTAPAPEKTGSEKERSR